MVRGDLARLSVRTLTSWIELEGESCTEVRTLYLPVYGSEGEIDFHLFVLEEAPGELNLQRRLVELEEAMDQIAALASPRSADCTGHSPDFMQLTRRERDILDQLLEGKSTKAMAMELHISPHTAKHHIHAIYQKYGVGSRAELLARFLA